MSVLSTVLADGVTITWGHEVWSFGWNVIIYLLVAGLVGFVAEAILRWRAPLGIIGAIVAGLIGIWLMTQVISISGVPDFYIPTNPPVPLFRALVGAIIFIAIWHLIFGSFRRRRYAAA